MAIDGWVGALLQDLDVRLVVAEAGGVARRARELHALKSASAALLAEGLCAGGLLSALGKEPRSVSLQLECDGPLAGIFVDTDGRGGVRGYAKNPDVAFLGKGGEYRYRPVLGNSGFLSVLRELDGGGHYRSSIELAEFDLAGDLERYFVQSDQLPACVLLKVVPAEGEPLGRVVGLVAQPLPSAKPGALDALREELRGPQGLSAQLARAPEADVSTLLAGMLSPHVFSPTGQGPLAFQCRCSPERVRNTLVALGKAELEKILETRGKAEVTCQFCSVRYEVGREELKALVASAESAPEPGADGT